MPGDRAELGELLVQLRGTGRSAPGVARALGVSRATYWRLEAGKSSALAYADGLDDLFGCGGALRAAIVRVEQGTWDPWGTGEPRNLHIHRWPAQYHGTVWLAFRSERGAAVSAHRVEIVWGAWARYFDLDVPEGGVVLTTGKSRDPDAAPDMSVNVTPAAHLLFGIDEPTVEPVLDIRSGWVPKSRTGGPRAGA